MNWQDEAKRFKRKVKCQVCGYQFDAVFSKGNPVADEIEFCLVCGARNFKFIEKQRREERIIEKR